MNFSAYAHGQRKRDEERIAQGRKVTDEERNIDRVFRGGVGAVTGYAIGGETGAKLGYKAGTAAADKDAEWMNNKIDERKK